MNSRYVFLLFLCSSQACIALYGPAIDRAPIAMATLACQESGFNQSEAIVRVLESQNLADATAVLPDALAELRATANTSPLYPARAFCIHELVPASIAMEPAPTPPVITQLKALGLDYAYYEPDARWVLYPNPVDLETVATDYLDSRWGRQAFRMMSELGWSRGGCQEGPDQFYTVIDRGRAFLHRFPASEVSNLVRRDVANAYATWWTLSKNPPGQVTTGPTHDYQQGAESARRAAIELYKEVLQSENAEPSKIDDDSVRGSLDLIETHPNDTQSYDFFCPDYED